MGCQLHVNFGPELFIVFPSLFFSQLLLRPSLFPEHRCRSRGSLALSHVLPCARFRAARPLSRVRPSVYSFAQHCCAWLHLVR
jgi:hypothetical protein